MQWELPLDLRRSTVARPGAVCGADPGRRQSPPLTGNVAPVSSSLAVNTGLQQTLGAFIATADSVDALLWLLYVSLAVAGLVTLLLAARMVAMRRSAELAMRRARGASLRQIGGPTARGAAVACVPAAAVGVALAVLVVPGPAAAQAAGGRPPRCCSSRSAPPPSIAAWQQRLPRRRPRRPAAAARRRTRLVAEATACLAAIAGIIVFRQQGTQAGAGREPVHQRRARACRVPAVIVVLRVYPLVLRGLLRGSAAARAPPRSSASPGRRGPRSPRRCPRSRWSSRSPWPRSPAWCGTRSPGARSPPPGRRPAPTSRSWRGTATTGVRDRHAGGGARGDRCARRDARRCGCGRPPGTPRTASSSSGWSSIPPSTRRWSPTPGPSRRSRPAARRTGGRRQPVLASPQAAGRPRRPGDGTLTTQTRHRPAACGSGSLACCRRRPRCPAAALS